MTYQVPQIILEQLGGKRFLAMTGAYSLTGSADALSMRLPRGPAGKRVGGVRITLDPSDTYTLVAFKLCGMKVVESFRESGIYCDQLAETFTEATGLYTSL
jgi:hypothetical protein